MTELIDTLSIVPGNNDRKTFDAAKLAELAQSIKEHGLIQPVTVRVIDTGTAEAVYQIVAGERRFRAVQLLGWAEIPAIVVELTDEEAAAVMLAENTARADLDPIEEAMAYHSRMTLYRWTINDVATRAGVSAIRVQFRLKLLALRPDIQHLVKTGNIALGYAQILSDANLDDNFQLLAVRTLSDNQSPTPAWFRRLCGQFQEKQNQAGLFDFSQFATVLTMQIAEESPAIPAPDTHKPPTVEGGFKERITAQIRFWRNAAQEWHRAGKPFKRQECEAAASALEYALAAI